MKAHYRTVIQIMSENTTGLTTVFELEYNTGSSFESVKTNIYSKKLLIGFYKLNHFTNLPPFKRVKGQHLDCE